MILVAAHHQSALIILFQRTKFHVRHQAEVVRLGCEKAMSIVPLKAVVCGLPKIGFLVGENLQTCAQLIFCGLVEPVEILGHVRLLEFFYKLHGVAPD
jgi:hypothetical protein